jgi:hypothetical protein
VKGNLTASVKWNLGPFGNNPVKQNFTVKPYTPPKKTGRAKRMSVIRR